MPSSKSTVQISIQVTTTDERLALSFPAPRPPPQSTSDGVSAAPFPLTGNLIVKLLKPVMVKSIYINFITSSTYHDDGFGEILQYTIYKHRLQIPLQSLVHSIAVEDEKFPVKKIRLEVGTYTYPFEMLLPAWLPPTVLLHHVSLLHTLSATLTLSSQANLPFPLNHLLPFQHKHQTSLQIPIYTLPILSSNPRFWKGASATYKLFWRVRTQQSAYVGHPTRVIFRLRASPGVQALGVEVSLIQQEQYYSCPSDIEKGPWGHILEIGGKRKVVIGNIGHINGGSCLECRGHHPLGGRHKGKSYSRVVTKPIYAEFPPSPNEVAPLEDERREATCYAVLLTIPVKDSDEMGSLKPSVDSPLVKVTHNLRFRVTLADRNEQDNKMSIAIPMNVLASPAGEGIVNLTNSTERFSDPDDDGALPPDGRYTDESSGESTRDGERFLGLPSYDEALYMGGDAWEVDEEGRFIAFGARRRRSVDTLPRYVRKEE